MKKRDSDKKPVAKNKAIDGKKHTSSLITSMWVGMPEHKQENNMGVKKLIVHFKTMEDTLKFAKLIGQPITAKTASVWFPLQKEELMLNKRWADGKK